MHFSVGLSTKRVRVCTIISRNRWRSSIHRPPHGKNLLAIWIENNDTKIPAGQVRLALAAVCVRKRAHSRRCIEVTRANPAKHGCMIAGKWL